MIQLLLLLVHLLAHLNQGCKVEFTRKELGRRMTSRGQQGARNQDIPGIPGIKCAPFSQNIYPMLMLWPLAVTPRVTLFGALALSPGQSFSPFSLIGNWTHCDWGTGDTFRQVSFGKDGSIFSLCQVRSRTRLRHQFIKRLATVNSLFECEQKCLNERAFKCLSFNYM